MVAQGFVEAIVIRVGIVWNTSSRERAFKRVLDEVGHEEDPRPEITGFTALVTGVGNRAQNRSYLALRIVLTAALFLVVGLVRQFDDFALRVAIVAAAAVIYQIAILGAVTFHVLVASEHEVMLVRVSKVRYRVQSVMLRDAPPQGVIELRPTVPWLLPYVGSYKRHEGDLFFHLTRPPSVGMKNWLATRFNPARSVPPRLDS